MESTNVFFAVTDENGMYVDERCVYYDEKTKKYLYSCYPSYYNKVLLGCTYNKSLDMVEKIKQLCGLANLNHNFNITPIYI